MLQVNFRCLSDNRLGILHLGYDGRLLRFDLAQQTPLVPNRAIKHLLKLPPCDMMQVIFAVQSAPVCADMLAIYAVRLAFTNAVLHCPRDEYVSVEIL